MSSQTQSLLDAALDYAALGYPVFPCHPGKKTPATPNGLKDATADPERIRAWWDSNPVYNVGLNCDGLAVVDVDPFKDGSPNPWAASLNGHGAALDAAPLAKTPRGGTHHVFAAPTGQAIGNSAGKVAPGIDVRGEGGYIVVAPSCGAAGEYEWVRNLPPRDELPTLPGWLVESTKKRPAAANANEPTEGIEIGEGGRNAALTRVAGGLRRYGLTPGEIEAALLKTNDERCCPPLPDDEVRTIARSVSRYDAGREFADDLGSEGFSFNTATAEEFLARSFKQEFFVENAIVGGEHLVIGGPKKAYKTSILMDLAVSLATGSPFLGHFDVPKPRRVIVVSAESGGATLQKLLRRVHTARGGEFEGRLAISLDLPNLTDPTHLGALTDEIDARDADVVVVDPAYLALMGGGGAEHAGNVFKMGQVLQGYGRVGIETGCTMCLVHHTSKASEGRQGFSSQPPGLSDLSQSGFAEWARQWILLNHRSQRQAGRAYLNLATGGSAGHGGEYQLDIDEGRPDDPLLGRIWDVSVRGAGGEEPTATASGAAGDRVEAVEKVLYESGEALSKTEIGKRTPKRLNNGYVTAALETLQSQGKALDVTAKGRTLWKHKNQLY